MEFSRLLYWSELPCPSPGDLSDPAIEPVSLLSDPAIEPVSLVVPALQVDSSPLSHQRSPFCFHTNFQSFPSISVKNAIGNLIGIALNLWSVLGSLVILAILILSILENGIAFHLFVPS